MARVYSASRVVFNRSIRNDVNMRVFEALACGSLLVTNDLAENGQDELFQDRVHLATYRESGRDARDRSRITSTMPTSARRSRRRGGRRRSDGTRTGTGWSGCWPRPSGGWGERSPAGGGRAVPADRDVKRCTQGGGDSPQRVARSGSEEPRPSGSRRCIRTARRRVPSRWTAKNDTSPTRPRVNSGGVIDPLADA